MNADLATDRAIEVSRIWPGYKPTPLIELPELALRTRVGRVFMKVEAERPLGSFKALGGMVAGLRALARAMGRVSQRNRATRRPAGDPLPRLICASDGNHGCAVAAAARHAGARASIYLPAAVSPVRSDRIEALGGDIILIGGTYDDAVAAAAAAAANGEGILIADTSTDPDDPVVGDVMDGYALLTREIVTWFREEALDRPGHLYIQAGVGGLAAAMANGLMDFMQEPKRLLVVEPESAACVGRALAAGRPVRVPGDLKTSAGMLSCGLASAPALKILLRHNATSVLVAEELLQEAKEVLRDAGGPETTFSGAAGLAGLMHVAARPRLRGSHQLGPDSCVLLVATEGAVAD